MGTTTYDIRDASVDSQIKTAIGNLDSSATVASAGAHEHSINKRPAQQ